jgi:hypothetical protein
MVGSHLQGQHGAFLQNRCSLAGSHPHRGRKVAFLRIEAASDHVETGGLYCQEIWKPLLRVGVSGRAEDETKMHMGGDEGDGLEAGNGNETNGNETVRVVCR